MARLDFEKDIERRRVPSVAHGPDAQFVDPRENLDLDLCQLRVGVAPADLSPEGLLGKKGRSLEGPTDPDAHHRGRAGVGPRGLDALDDEVLDPLEPRRGREHVHTAHVLRAAPFRDGDDPDPVSGDDVEMDDGGRVVFRVGPREGVAGRLPEIAFPVSFFDPLVDGRLQIASDNVDILPDLDKKDGKARVLAYGGLLVPGDAGIFLELAHDLPGHGGFVPLDGPVEGSKHVNAQIAVGVDEEVADGLGNFCCLDFSHDLSNGLWTGDSSAEHPQAASPKPQGLWKTIYFFAILRISATSFSMPWATFEMVGPSM